MVITVNALGNLSFLSLLGSMIFYWVGISFEGFTIQQKTESVELQTNRDLTSSNPFRVLSGVKKNLFSVFGRYSIIASNLLLALLLVLRWKESGHFPLSNLYESLMFLSWCFTGLHLFFFSEEKGSSRELTSSILFSEAEENRKRISTPIDVDPLASQRAALLETGLNKTSDVNFQDFKRSADKFLGAITTPSALFTNAFATFTLPKEMQEASPLVPALQSNWLMMHVTVMILSYAALILGSLLSIAYLIITFNSEKEKTTNQTNLTYAEPLSPFPSTSMTAGGLKESNLLTEEIRLPISMNRIHEVENSLRELSSDSLSAAKTVLVNTKKQKLAWILDNLSYRILGIGFPFLTIGILSGAVWANEAWGSYWSWDPKETWALLTWLIFAIYLHIRLNKGWEGKKPAIIASFGFVIVWICYLGVNLIGEGLHSYGWLSQS